MWYWLDALYYNRINLQNLKHETEWACERYTTKTFVAVSRIIMSFVRQFPNLHLACRWCNNRYNLSPWPFVGGSLLLLLGWCKTLVLCVVGECGQLNNNSMKKARGGVSVSSTLIGLSPVDLWHTFLPEIWRVKVKVHYGSAPMTFALCSTY